LKSHPYYPSLLAIHEVLKTVGIKNKVCQVPFEELFSLPLPLIAWLKYDSSEFLLLTRINENVVYISDKTRKNEPMPEAHFRKYYSGIVLLTDAGRRQYAKKSNKNELAKGKSDDQVLLKAKPLKQKISYLDIGASYGLPVKWEPYAHDQNFSLFMVEPDARQVDELRKTYPLATVIPVALGEKHRIATLYHTVSQSCSSLLPPNMEVLNRFPIGDSFRVISQSEIETFRFDIIAEQLGVAEIDFVKIDVQGFEYEVLEGFGKRLDDILCIELEAHLSSIYKNEKTLFHINEYLSSKGFFLRHLEIVGAFEGEVLEFDAFFVRKRPLIDSKRKKELVSFWETVNRLPPAKRYLKM
jgi:FkbM family methyltransferase